MPDIFSKEEGKRRIVKIARYRIWSILCSVIVVACSGVIYYLLGGRVETFEVICLILLAVCIGSYFIVRSLPDFPDLQMPSYTAHAMMTSGLVIGFACAGIAFDPGFYFLAGGAAVGLIVQPDLDLKHKGYWRLYGDWSKHRGRSHAPVIGTLGRMLYLLWLPIILVLWALYVGFPIILGRWWPYFGLVFVGLCLADTCHWGLDKIDKRMGGRL